ncbi:MAG: zinc ribbon domain-containing protein, partial [Vulcanisaeta sp.]
YRQEYPNLNSQLVIEAIRQASGVAKSFVERRRKGLVNKPYPEVKTVSIRFVETTWNYEEFVKSIAPVRVWISPISTGKRGRGGRRFEAWLRLHKRFWQYWWKVLRGEAKLASTLIIKRKTNKWYAIFVFKLKPREEEPESIVAFDINENTVAVSRVDLPSTADKVASWNRQYITPQLYEIRTDFGRLARRYERVRNAIIERLKPDFLLSNGKYINITNTREFRKRVKRLREGDRKIGRVRHVANELTKTPAIIVTEDLGEKPQDEMINGVGKGELRHRIKQTPFKSIEKTVEDKALERGSKLFHVSSYRNSRVCPIHFVRLKSIDDWHTLQCPKGHYVNRDYASVMNMTWKTTPESWTKAFWWNMKQEMNWREHEGKSNPIIPYEIVKHIHAMLKTFKASLKQSPAVLARGKPMNHHRIQNEGGGEETSHTLSRQGGGQNSALVLIGEGGVVYLAFNDFGDGERGLVKARISKGLSLTYAVEGVPFRAFVIDEKSVNIFKMRPYFILIPLNVDRDLGRRFILRSVLRKDVDGGWSGEFREVDYDEFRDRASDVLIRFLFHPVGGLSVKRAIISRDPFSIVGLTNEFAFALMGEGDELYLIYKDLDDDEGMVRTSVKEDSIIFMGTQL